MNPTGVVFDHTALLALGAGTALLSRIVDRAHYESGRHVYVPALCLSAAVAERPALADHIGALPAMEVLDLGFASAGVVGELVAADVDWRVAQAIDAGRPSLDWPYGRPVLTAVPEQFARWGVATINWAL